MLEEGAMLDTFLSTGSGGIWTPFSNKIPQSPTDFNFLETKLLNLNFVGEN